MNWRYWHQHWLNSIADTDDNEVFKKTNPDKDSVPEHVGWIKNRLSSKSASAAKLSFTFRKQITKCSFDSSEFDILAFPLYYDTSFCASSSCLASCCFEISLL